MGILNSEWDSARLQRCEIISRRDGQTYGICSEKSIHLLINCCKYVKAQFRKIKGHECLKASILYFS